MRKIGLAGGIGCGKTEVTIYLEQAYGAEVIRADELGKEVCMPGTECNEKLQRLLGNAFFRADGTMDRRLVGNYVFENPGVLQKMNAIIHPAVDQRVKEQIEQSRSELVVLEAALFFEARYERYCDEVWYIYADLRTRWRRIRVREGMNRKKFEDVLIHQMNESDLRRACDRVIDNRGPLESTKHQIDLLLKNGSV